MEKIKKIKMVQQGSMKAMAKHFNVTVQTIHNALTNQRSSELCKKIRQYALNHGGIEY